MKLKKVKHGLINITDQSVNMGIIFYCPGDCGCCWLYSLQ